MRFRHGFIIHILTLAMMLSLGVLQVAVAADTSEPSLTDWHDTPLLLYKTRDLSFGKIIPSAAKGTVTVHPINGRSSNTVIVVPTSLYSTAQFSVYGKKHEHYNICLPSSTTITNGNASMRLDNFLASTISSPNRIPPSPSLDNKGFDMIEVGATLHIEPQQSAGRYTGAFTVIVAYD